MRSELLVLSLPLLFACKDKDSDDTAGGDDTSAAACVEENGACVLTGAILEDMTLTADKAWLLRSAVTVGDDSSDVTLTIEAGTTIYGESATNGFLVISRGAKINAVGTADAPIVFTSDQAVGSRARGDWGGLALNGRAPINACTDGATPCEAEGEGGTGVYGGDDPADSSGTLKYVRVEFGGTEISPDNEINGIGMQGVGSGTTVDYVQVHRNLDDGIEFFGGTVNVKHLLITAAADDGIDWDLGYQGKIQFAAVVQSSDAGNNGLETDNNEEDHTATPASSPTVSNLTIIGSPDIAEDNFGFLMRRGSQPEVYSVAIAGFSSACLALRDQATYDAFAAGDAMITSSALACEPPYEDSDQETETGTEEGVYEADASNQLLSDLGLTSVNPSSPDLRPASGSALLGAGTTPSNSFFTAVDYVGAFDASTDWTDGWTSFDAN